MISIASDKRRRGELLAALSDGTRAEIVEMLAHRPHAAGELHRAFPIAAPAVSRHLRVLREAGVIEERRSPDDKRVRLYALRTEELDGLATWLEEMSRTWQSQLDAFKDFVAVRVEQPGGTR